MSSKQIKLDTIVRTSLQDHGLPLHYYFRFLNWAIRGLKQINYDFPVNIKSIRRPVLSYNAVIVPDDFVDLIMVGEERSDEVVPFINNSALNRLNKLDSDGNKVKFPAPDHPDDAGLFHVLSSEDNFNNFGEYKGRDFAYVGGKFQSYVYVPERNEIQFKTTVDASEVVLNYISDGVVTSQANVVHPYAEEAILSWIRWNRLTHLPRLHRNETAESKAERRYYNDNRILRGRMNEMNIWDIFNAGRRGHHMGIKE